MYQSVLSLFVFAMAGSVVSTSKGKGHIIIAGGHSHQPIPIPIPIPVPFPNNYQPGWSQHHSSLGTGMTTHHGQGPGYQTSQLIHPYSSLYRPTPQIVQPNYYPTKIVILPILTTNIDDDHQARWIGPSNSHSSSTEQYFIQPIGPHSHSSWQSSFW